MRDVPVVAVCFDHSRQHYRDLWTGIQEYALHGRGWVLSCRPTGRGIRGWPFAGVIAHLTDPRQARTLRALGLPLVDTAGTLPRRAVPRVAADDRAIGALAARHFLDRGHRHFAVFTYGEARREDRPARAEGFEQELRDHGLSFHRCSVPAPARRSAHAFHRAVQAWLEGLPRPVAIFADEDLKAEWLLELCRIARLRVPEDVAVLGVGDDALVCEGTWPPLSSIQLPGRRIGLEAARLLEDLMQDRPPPSAPVLMSPTGMTVRRSSDSMAIEDPAVAAALRRIRGREGGAVGIRQVLQACGLPRRSLERRFRAATGQSLLAAIHQARVERASALLAGTDLKIAAVAAASGFTDALHLRRVFRKLTGTTPSAFRRKGQSPLRL